MDDKLGSSCKQWEAIEAVLGKTSDYNMTVWKRQANTLQVRWNKKVLGCHFHQE
jgi:hypothetical protein